MDFKQFEMTLSFGQTQDYPMPDFTGAEHIGDIEQYKILHKQFNGVDCYAITVVEKPVCCIQTQPIEILGNTYTCLQNIFTEKDYQNQKFAKNLLFFLRNVEKKSMILGDAQSRAGQEFNKSIARTKRFPMFWLNTITGEQHPYDPEKDHFELKPYRDVNKATEWVIMIEGEQNGWMDENRFLAETIEQGANWFKRYMILFEDADAV
jgi:hypothetical protein